MRLVIGMMGLLTVLGIGTSAREQREEPRAAAVCELKVEDMTCGACAARFEREVKKIKGVVTAKVDFDEARARVEFLEAETSPEAIAETITERSGFKTSVVPRAPQ